MIKSLREIVQKLPKRLKYGGIAQLARALGSYPGCRWFESDCRYHIKQCTDFPVDRNSKLFILLDPFQMYHSSC